MASGTVARATVAIARQSVLSVSLPQRYADFLNDCPKVVMMLGICALRWSGDLPAIALSRSFCSMSFSDIPALLNAKAYRRKRSFPSPGYWGDSSAKSWSLSRQQPGGD